MNLPALQYKDECIMNACIAYSKHANGLVGRALQEKGSNSEPFANAIKGILLKSPDLDKNAIDIVVKMIASNSMRTIFDNWIKKNPDELKLMRIHSNIGQKILVDLMNKIMDSGVFHDWLVNVPERKKRIGGQQERDQIQSLPYRDGDFCITPFGIFLKDGTKLYKPALPELNGNISGFSGRQLNLQGDIQYLITFYDGKSICHKHLYNQRGTLITDKLASNKTTDSSSPNSTGSAPSA